MEALRRRGVWAGQIRGIHKQLMQPVWGTPSPDKGHAVRVRSSQAEQRGSPAVPLKLKKPPLAK